LRCNIAINAGEDGSVAVGQILDKATYGFGYNAQMGAYGDLPPPLPRHDVWRLDQGRDRWLGDARSS
jgi:hypothetical protein